MLHKNIFIKFIVFSTYLFLSSCATKTNNNVERSVETVDRSIEAIEAKEKSTQDHSIHETAKLFTVKILTANGNNGTGILFRKNEDKYYILTTKHTFKNTGNDEKIIIITSDRKYHYTTLNSSSKLENLDLIVLEFASNETYKIANFARQLNLNESVYLFGYKACDKKIGSELESEQFTIGKVFDSTDSKDIYKSKEIEPKENTSKPKEYDTFYSNASIAGMSGSPLLNSKGEVIAIHGESGYKKETIEDGALQSCEDLSLSREFENNWGISVKNFIASLPDMV